MPTHTIITNGADSHTVNRRTKLDERMSTVVCVCWKCLALRTEVSIMAHSTFVANTSNVTGDRLVLAKRAVAKYAVVDLVMMRRLGDCLINRGEAMARMTLWSIRYAFRAVVPIWAGQAFVTYADNALGTR